MTNPHRVSLIIAGLALAATTAGAQTAERTNARWQAWYGCWTAAPHDREARDTIVRTVCMTPTNDVDVVEVIAIARGTVAHRDTIDASGRVHAVAEDGCNGTQTSRWSADGRRVFITSLTTCSGAVTKTSGVLAMTPFGEWLDIRSVESAGNTATNVARYRDIGLSPVVPSEVIAAIRSYGPNVDAARLASGAPIPASAVIEASKILNTAVVEAWVTQSGLDFVTDSRALQQLADAGISGAVTDAMVTVEANSRDVYDRWVDMPYGRSASDYWDQGTGQRVPFSKGGEPRLVIHVWQYDPWGYGLNMWRYGRQYTHYAFGTNNWSWLYGPDWGFSGLGRIGYTESNVGSMLPPTIVLHQGPTNTASRGRAETADNTDQPKSDGILAKAINAITGAGSSPTAPKGSSGKPSPR